VARRAAPAVRARRAARRCVARASDGSGIDVTDLGDGTYDVDIEKPVPIKFCRGNDGGCYIKELKPSPRSDLADFAVGDKVVKISASFGSEVWDAENYGQVMFAMKTRNGDVYMQFRKCNGDLTAIEAVSEDAAHQRERNSGNYGEGTKELQLNNYQRLKELEKERAEMFNEALGYFRESDFRKSLETFEDVIGLEPPNYMGDDFSRYTLEYKLSHYNVACCYGKLGEEGPGLEALRVAFDAGFEDYKKVRSDPNLAGVRSGPDFDKVMDMYDEPIINGSAIRALKKLFS